MLGPTLLGGVMYRSEDLAPLMAPPADSGVIRGGQGVVVEWDADTGTNIIRYRGTDLHNVPIVRSNNEILSLKPGDVVLLNIIGAGPFATVYIVGQVTRPGPEVAAAIRAGVARGIFSDSVATFEQQQRTTWSDLPSFGPQLTDVPIGESGMALVILSAEIAVGNPGTSITSPYAGMSCEIRNSADEVVELPGGDRALAVSVPFGSGDEDVLRVTGSRVVRYRGLEPGPHTFTAKYKSADAGGVAQWLNRNLTVIAL